MKREVLISTITALSLSIVGAIPVFSATPSAKIGAACSKVGVTVKANGLFLQCAKNGKKLIWTKSVTTSTSATTVVQNTSANPTTPTTVPVTPTPAASPKAAPQVMNPIPIPLPVPLTGTLTFANAAGNFAQIPKIAWQRVQDLIAANPSVSIPTTIDIGPNTKADLATITSALDRENKLFAGFQPYSKYFGFVYNATDLAWAESDAAMQFQKAGIHSGVASTQGIKQQAEAGCEFDGAVAKECGGGMALTFKDGGSDAGGTFYGVQSGYQGIEYWMPNGKNVGPMTQVNHEATHNYQFSQFINLPLKSGQHTASDQSHEFTPWWYSEGQANAIGISTFLENYSDYQRVRDDIETRNPGSQAAKPRFTAEGLKTFLTEYQPTGPQNHNWMLAYSIGMATVEALNAIGGPQSTLALYALGGNGEDWNTAFQHVYGISWDEGATYLSQILAAEYAAKPMN